MKKEDSLFQNSPWKNQTSIAFVGSLYTEEHLFYDRIQGLSPYTKGFLDGLMNSPKNIYGYNFIEEILKEHPLIIEELYAKSPMNPQPYGVETKEYLYAQYVLNRKLTSMERIDYLSAIGSMYPFDLYTPNKKLHFPEQSITERLTIMIWLPTCIKVPKSILIFHFEVYPSTMF